jgi:UDP-N-acetylmuramate--alanine ligase
MTKEQLITWVKADFSKTINKDFGEVLITAGAGDIDAMVGQIKEILEA